MSANQSETESEDSAIGELVIVLNPADVVTALRNRYEYPDRNGQEVITVRPPFDGEVRGEHRFSEAGNYWPAEMSPKPLDLSPRQFLDDEGRKRVKDVGYPTWGEVRRQLAGTDEEGDDEALRRSYDEWAELWEHEVRNALAGEIDVNEFGHGPIKCVPVRYTDGEDQ